jgi:hypothetical protein
MDFRILDERAATGYKDQSHDKAKESEKVPVHAQGYILIVFEVITIHGGLFCQRLVSRKNRIITVKPRENSLIRKTT